MFSLPLIRRLETVVGSKREVFMTKSLKIVPLFTLVLLVMGAASAQVVTANVTATELFDFPTVGRLLNPGIVICPGGYPGGFQPIENLFFPCPLGSRAAIRGVTVEARMTGSGANAQLVTGWNVIEENANYDPNLSRGRLWGKFTLTLDAGGVWEGVYTGVKTENGQPKETIRAVGHGSGALVDGMQLEATIVNTFPAPFTIAGALQGMILQVPRAE